MKIINKLNNMILKHEKIFVLLLIAIAVSAFSFNILIDANDELWNFSNIYKMANGEKIYKDCNVIVTPLFFYLGRIIFKILGANLLTFRIYNLIINITFYYLIYTLLRKIKISKTRSITYSILMYTITFRLILIGANYNMLAIIFVILGILNLLKEERNEIKDNILQGIISFLVFMSKQNIGLFYVIGLAIYNIIISKNNIRQILKKMIIQFLAFLIPLIIYIIYLYNINSLYDFISYTILGLGEFNFHNMSYDISIYIFVIELIICIFFICYVVANRTKIEEIVKKNMVLLITFSITMLGIAYPIFNTNHVIIASIVLYITIIYFVDKNIIEKKGKDEKIDSILKKFNAICMIGIIILSICINKTYLLNITENPYEPYYGGVIKKETQDEINKITTYILEQEKKGINVKVISYKANLYMNVLRKNNKEMDLAFYGNLGKDGEEGLIEKIKKLKNTHILISKGKLEYQESKKIKDYIMQNLEQIGEIEEFYILKTIN